MGGRRRTWPTGDRPRRAACFDGVDRLAVHEEEVVGAAVTGGHEELPDGDALAGVEVHLVSAVDDPAARDELAVDLDTGARLGCQICVICHASGSEDGRRHPSNVRGGGVSGGSLEMLDHAVGGVVELVLEHAASSDGEELRRVADEHDAPVEVVGERG